MKVAGCNRLEAIWTRHEITTHLTAFRLVNYSPILSDTVREFLEFTLYTEGNVMQKMIIVVQYAWVDSANESSKPGIKYDQRNDRTTKFREKSKLDTPMVQDFQLNHCNK